MQSCYLRAESLTPLVIAGADPKSPDVLAEGLRPPSLRGAMRWWFRAMMGSIVGAHDNYKTLRDLEGKIFGATDQGSSVRLRTYPVEDVKPDIAYLCMNDDRDLSKSGGKNYRRISKSSIHPNAKFRIQLDSRSDEVFRMALSSLWLTAMLGGLGNRARRGFGSLALSPEEDTTEAIQRLNLDFSYPNKSLADIAQWLEKGLNQVHGHFKNYVSAVDSPPPAKFSVPSKAQAKLWLIKPQNEFWSTWSEAMNALREDIYRSYKGAKSLPEIGSARPRLASPLIIQIKRIARDKYFGVLLVFNEKHNPKRYLGTNWSDFVRFLKNLKSYEHQEVILP